MATVANVNGSGTISGVDWSTTLSATTATTTPITGAFTGYFSSSTSTVWSTTTPTYSYPDPELSEEAQRVVRLAIYDLIAGGARGTAIWPTTAPTLTYKTRSSPTIIYSSGTATVTDSGSITFDITYDET